MEMLTKPCEVCGSEFTRYLDKKKKNQNFCSKKCHDDSRRGVNRVESPVHSRGLYGTWNSMKARCFCVTNPRYSDWGGRGITICDEWMNGGYPAFESWGLSHGYKPGLTIERIDNDKPYSPGNCSFIERSEQARNKRNNRYLTAFGETKMIVDWARDDRCVVAFHTLYDRLFRYKLSPEDAITRPVYEGIALFGETKIAEKWAEDSRCQVPGKTIIVRMLRGWTAEEAITLPRGRRPRIVNRSQHSNP